jgi:glutamate-ammonia-ligase adenylyltransferase
MRWKLEESHARTDLKRGYGGLSDIEFLVHYLQLVHAAELPEVLRPNLWDAIDSLRRLGVLPADAHAELREAYDFWRTVESRLRIVHNGSPADLPDNPEELARLARRLNYRAPDISASSDSFRADAARHASRSRALFQQFVGLATGE